MRTCERRNCKRTFVVFPSDAKKYCSRSCAANCNNTGRRQSEETKQKIANSLKGRKGSHPAKGTILVPRIEARCLNLVCGRIFTHERYQKRRYCSNQCAMSIIGGSPTSSKASRGKSGIRPDIHSSICFYSRWEANMGRLYSYLGITWLYAPQTFDIGGQRYTPDFYLPESDTYVEVKNFWNDYSRIRDEKFRNSYPNLRLKVILKDEYLALEKTYARLIPMWEYKNSPTESKQDS